MALRLLKEGKRSLHDIAQTINVHKSKLIRISKFLEKILNPSKVKGGAPTILTSQEEAMIVQRLIFEAKRGFAVDKDSLKSLMSQISSDGRPTFKTGIPSDDAIRAFRASHREITFRNSENKDKGKFKGES